MGAEIGGFIGNCLDTILQLLLAILALQIGNNNPKIIKYVPEEYYKKYGKIFKIGAIIWLIIILLQFIGRFLLFQQAIGH